MEKRKVLLPEYGDDQWAGEEEGARGDVGYHVSDCEISRLHKLTEFSVAHRPK